MKRTLEKYECLSKSCGHSFLADMESADSMELSCPFCKGVAESTAHQSHESSLKGQLDGCLYPSKPSCTSFSVILDDLRRTKQARIEKKNCLKEDKPND